MPARLCRVCGREFQARTNAVQCGDAHLKDCTTCGDTFTLTVAAAAKGFAECPPCRKVSGRKKQSEAMREKFASGELEGFRSRELQAKAKAAVQERYGVDNVSSDPEVRARIEATMVERFGGRGPAASAEVQGKIAETNVERYGAASYFGSTEGVAKVKATLEKNYGVTNPTLDPEIRAKQLSTMQSRHGVNQPLENEEILKRQVKTMMERHGVKNSAMLENVRENTSQRMVKVSDKDFTNTVQALASNAGGSVSIPLLLETFGYGNPSPIYKRIKKLALESFIDYSVSLPNATWRKKLEDTFGVSFSPEGKIFTNPRWRCDLYLPEKKLAIDINPTISHSTQQCHPYFKPKSGRYHQERALDAEANGWTLYQIYDWSDEAQAMAQLGNLLGLNGAKTMARKCVVTRPSRAEVAAFLAAHHHQGAKAMGNIFFGLEQEGVLVQVMTFSKERWRGASDGYELIRLASYGTVSGGASKLFTAFVRAYEPELVKTFASLDTGQGKVYSKLGFEFTRLAALNALYAKPGTAEAHKVTACSQKFGKIYGGLGLTQQEYMNSLGFYRINDAGNKIFTWRPKGGKMASEEITENG